MSRSFNTSLLIEFLAVVAMFLLLIGGGMSGAFKDHWTNGGGGMMGPGFGGYGWLWIPTLLTLAAAVLLGWMLIARKK
jgi:hypothetical protein